ncbi:hypothetical protein GJ496_006678 [Pomphorhynchus laevis]|nr:hypothetical protein GJ496_006678 [Pomphorhynchus laevis]
MISNVDVAGCSRLKYINLLSTFIVTVNLPHFRLDDGDEYLIYTMTLDNLNFRYSRCYGDLQEVKRSQFVLSDLDDQKILESSWYGCGNVGTTKYICRKHIKLLSYISINMGNISQECERLSEFDTSNFVYKIISEYQFNVFPFTHPSYSG